MSSPFPPFPFSPFPEIVLPGFLRPLLLVPIAQHRVADTVKSWLDGRHTQIFGPLEQLVAAVVIIGLAVQTPPDFWARPVGPDHNTRNSTSDDSSGNATTASTPHPATSDSWHPSFLSGMVEYLTNFVNGYSLSPTTLGLIAMGLYLGLMLIPADLKTRLKTSWDLFRPPWKDRSLSEPSSQKSTESERARERKVQPETADRLDKEDARHQERARRKETEREKAKAEAAGKRNGSPETEVDGDDEVGGEKGSTLDEKEKLKMRQKERLKAAEEARGRGEGLTEGQKARLAAKREKVPAKQNDPEARSTGRGPDHRSETKKNTNGKVGDPVAEAQAGSRARAKDAKMVVAQKHGRPTDLAEKDHPASERDLYGASTTRGKGVSPATPDQLEPEGLSRSERARWVKRREAGEAMPATSQSRSAKSDVRVQNVNPSAESGAKLSTRPANAHHTTEGELTASERAQVAKDPSGKSSSNSKEVQRRDKSTEDRSSTGETSATSDEEDALMAGDYRPLKSVLKKSKKKPRQKKNIHHNYFITMRGYQPHLIPFPHGFHPKPHHPRHTLWYDNVLKNADHIMAPPPVPKAPEGDENEGQVEKNTVVEEISEATADNAGNGKTSKVDKKTAKNKDVPSTEEDRKTTVNPIKDDQRVAQTEKSRAKDADGSRKGDSGKSTSSGEKIPDGDKAKSAATVRTETPLKERQNDKDNRTEIEEKKSKEKQRERSRLKAEAEAEESARARAKKDEEANNVPLQTKRIVPVVDPHLKANFVAHGLLCCLLYMINQQLALLLLLFFAYKFLQTETSVTERSTSSDTKARYPPLSDRADPGRTGGIPNEMEKNLRRAEAVNARKEGKEDARERTSRTDKAKENREPKASDEANPNEKGESDGPRAGAEQRSSKSQTGKIGEQPIRGEAKTPRSLADLTPEQKEKHLKALAARKANGVEKGKSAERSPASAEQKSQNRSDSRTTESTGRDAKFKLADMTDGEREAYMAARIRRKERERLVERANNTSGLSID